ncbi:MAG: DUF1846 domain-containing protein [Anaerolineae bacterium]|nr:DUF1846 domain-containing protein [Anaerolineae bacterium]
MSKKNGFDNEIYLKAQTAAILERVQRFSKLYLEFGGKLVYDYHAARVLPGFHPNVKMHLLQQLGDQIDVIICIYAGDIERKKIRGDFGITYESDALKTIDDLAEWGIAITAVVITRYDNQPAATLFKHRLERRGVKVYTHRYTKGYPTDINTVVSEEGYGANPCIETTRPLVVVTGPGPGSGKLATCLSQLYHEHQRGVNAGYAKFETFPIWNLPLKHEVNVAYEAATAELRDVNMIDHFHLEAYNQHTVNYNRDLEAFPLLRRIIERITGQPSFYKSPTDMGVNRAGLGIVDDAAVRQAAAQEVIRRYFRYACEYAMGLVDRETVQRLELLMDEIRIGPEQRTVVLPARQAAIDAQARGVEGEMAGGAAIDLHDGTLIVGKGSPTMHAPSALILNATKHLAGIPHNMHLLPPSVIASVSHFKKDILRGKSVGLDLQETLIALSISATANPAAQLAIEKLQDLSGCEVHITHIPTPGDAEGLRKLGVNLTSDPDFATKFLFED